jgi:hypothetical protein
MVRRGVQDTGVSKKGSTLCVECAPLRARRFHHAPRCSLRRPQRRRMRVPPHRAAAVAAAAARLLIGRPSSMCWCAGSQQLLQAGQPRLTSAAVGAGKPATTMRTADSTALSGTACAGALASLLAQAS